MNSGLLKRVKSPTASINLIFSRLQTYLHAHKVGLVSLSLFQDARSSHRPRTINHDISSCESCVAQCLKIMLHSTIKNNLHIARGVHTCHNNPVGSSEKYFYAIYSEPNLKMSSVYSKENHPSRKSHRFVFHMRYDEKKNSIILYTHHSLYVLCFYNNVFFFFT